MNMKKTIAAIAAGAVAVSAMATTVSALEAKTLTYNLVKTTKNQNAKGTVTATFTNVPLEAGGNLVIDTIAGASWNAIVTISGSFWDDAAGTNKSFVPVVATGMDWETGYSIEGSKLWTAEHIVTVPVVAGTAQGTNVALKATSSAVITVTVKYTDLPDSVNYVGALNGLIKEGKRGIKITSVYAKSDKKDGKDATLTYKAGDGTPKAYVVRDQASINALNNLDLTYSNTTFKWTVSDRTDASVVTDGSVLNVGGLTVSDKDTIKNNLIASVAAPADTATGVYTLSSIKDAAGNISWVDEKFNVWTVTPAGSIAVTGKIVVDHINPDAMAADKTDLVNKAISFVQSVDDGDTIHVEGYEAPKNATDGVLYASDLSGAATETGANDEKKVPYHSTLNNSIYNTPWSTVAGSINGVLTTTATKGSGDVFAWVGYANSDSNEGIYSSTSQQISDAARSVINDAVQNYSDVIFTFNTATSNVKIIRDQQGNITDYQYTSDGVKARENKDKGSEEIVNYTSFGRHFWDRDTGYDVNTLYITNDWLGNNLFEGALVINNNITLSLGATDKFDWTATSLSFSWDAIQDSALTQNQYANYIQNMVLRTSADWFWDNMQVVLGETETEEVDSGAPVEGDTEDLPEEEPEAEEFGEEEEEPEVEAEPEPEPEVEVEPEPAPAPVETATNPGTGNASVALAVIPVALAAAAIVAKKRG